MPLALEQQGSDFVLHRTDAAGQQTSITLGEDDILFLAQAIQPWRDRVLARRSRAGAEAEIMTDVVQIQLNTDLHRSEVHLTMFDRHGARAGYALPPGVARLLADHLPARVEQIESAGKTRTRQ